MEYNDIAKKIIGLEQLDLALRDRLAKSGVLGEGYNKQMKELHNSNADILNGMIDMIGYPTINKVGKQASKAAWLIIQHAIERPSFMRKCVELLEIAVSDHQADPINLAYLQDRILVFEGKPQRYGTQFDWDARGRLSPNTFDNLSNVNQRRKSLGLNTIEEQTEVIRKRAEKENQKPPADFEKRKREFEKWRSVVGWCPEAG